MKQFLTRELQEIRNYGWKQAHDKFKSQYTIEEIRQAFAVPKDEIDYPTPPTFYRVIQKYEETT